MAVTLRLFPLFLGIGKHAREDLPLLVTQLREQYPQATFELMATAGSDARVTDLLADMALENALWIQCKSCGFPLIERKFTHIKGIMNSIDSWILIWTCTNLDLYKKPRAAG